MPASPNRILTTHVGSLIRPDDLVALLKSRDPGDAQGEAKLAKALDKAVADIVKKQIDVGIDIISDGEFGKSISWSRYILERLNGVERKPELVSKEAMPKAVFGQERKEFAEFYAEYDKTQNFAGMSGWAVTGPISYKGQPQIQHDIAAFKAGIGSNKPYDAFMPAVSPASVAPERVELYYKNSDESLEAIAKALGEEYKAIVDGGFILQVDDAYFAHVRDTYPDLQSYRRWAGAQVEVINTALKGLPKDRVRFHVCWGSWNGPHVYDVEIKDIVDLMLKINVGGYSIEMANPRHEHEWIVWKDTKLPDDRVLVPGVISHATNVVEHPELVSERIVRLANLVGRDRVIASTDCGFAQGPFVRRVHPSIQWAKLEALVAGARLASKKLWN